MLSAIKQPVPRIHYGVLCFDENGDLVWSREFTNLVVNQGLDYILNTGAVTGIAVYMGLVSGATTPTFAAADTLASHSGWTEFTSYTQTAYPTITWGTPSAGSMSGSAVSFSINASGTVAGAFTLSDATLQNTTGNLYSEGAFSGGNAAVQNGYTLQVTPTLSV